ncbi:sigma-70 family RNA polymerase sigma factor [Lachnospiraceae bacterium MD335]|nr:sigma-70 family RNA polymerase sigma factor [Lachnospiraceae bacterium MD335]
MTDKDLSALQSDILNAYYADNAKKLHRVVDRILSKFGGLTYKDTDDFYSLANEVFADVLKRYDYEQSFDGFLYSCLSNKIMSEITKRNREKRKADRMSISLEATNDKGEDYSLLDCLASDFDTFEEASKRQENGQYQDRVQQYISRLSNQQVNILNLLIDGYKPFEIRRILEISKNEYVDNLSIMRSYENVRLLFQI